MTVPDLSDTEIEDILQGRRALHWEHAHRLLRRAQIAESALDVICSECPLRQTEQRVAGEAVLDVDDAD
jgi:hypothetical protein